MIYRSAAAFLAVLAAVLALSAANVQATLIDSFDAGSQSLSASPGTPYSLSQSHVGPDALGDYRDVAIQWLAGRQSYVDVLADPTLAGLSFTQGTGQAVTTVTWDGLHIPNVLTYTLNANLTTGGENEFVFDVEQVTGPLSLTLTVYTNDASHSSVYSCPMTVAMTGTTLSVPYTSFSGTANFSDIDAIVLRLDGTGHSGSDVTLKSLKTDDKGPSVPEPSTLALAAVGAFVFLGAGRRWKRN
jgi:hypothetical protein